MSEPIQPMEDESGLSPWLVALGVFVAVGLILLVVWAIFFRSAAPLVQQPAPAVNASAPTLPTTVPVTYTIKRGDTLTTRFGKNSSPVCKLNKLADCDKLSVGQVLTLPAGVLPLKVEVKLAKIETPKATKQVKAVTPSKPAVVAEAAPVVAPKARQSQAVAVTPRVSGNRDADGIRNWGRVGASAVKKFRDGDPVYQNWARSQVLAALGYNAYETKGILERFNSSECVTGTISAGDVFENGSFLDKKGNVKVTGPVRLTDTSEPTFAVCRVYINAGDVINGYTFTRDAVVTLVYKCANVVVERRPPPPPLPEIPPVVIPPVPPTIIPPPAYLPPPPEAKKFCNNWRLNAVVGAELEIGKGWSRSLYGAWGVYCMRIVKDGQIGFGPAGQLAVYGGDPGRGHFNGHLIQAGIGMMRVWNSGQDLEAKLMLGHYSSSYRETDYRANQNVFGIGFSAAFNDYHGRIDGSGTPETQGFFNVFLPVFGGNSEHSWQGQDIGDASKLKLYANIGVRRYLLKENPERRWNPYVQVGALMEASTGEDYFSCSVRVGVTNQRRTIGVHAGVNACNGGIVPAIGAWYDLGTDLRLKRAERRAAALEEDTGEGREATTTFEGRPLAETLEGDAANDNIPNVEAVNDNEGSQADTVVPEEAQG